MIDTASMNPKVLAFWENLPVGLQETLSGKPEVMALLAEGDIKKFIAYVVSESSVRKVSYPSKDFVPNIAQERALLCYRQRHPTYGDYPLVNVFTGSNALGKTAVAAVLLAAITLGPKFLHSEYLANHSFFKECDEKRKKRRLRVRLVVHKADMGENGSMYQEISKWIPEAKFSGKQGDYYTKVTIPAPGPGYFETIVDVKTFDMEKKAHAGPTLDFIIVNEPMPESLYTENLGRLRDDGHMAMFLTPINDAAYLHKVVNSGGPEGEVVHACGTIWENCADIPGMRGHLAKQKVEALIRGWTSSNPLEVEARVYGKFVHLAGSIFPLFNQGAHVVGPTPIDPKWNGYHGIDPHPVKPPVALWMMQGPLDVWYVVGEYPTEPWDEIGRTPLTIEQMAVEMNRIEQGRHPQFPYGIPLNVMERIGDPNGMKAEMANNRSSMKQEFDRFLPSPLNINVDNDIGLRHNKINDLLFYDSARPIGPMNMPHIYVFSWCKNAKRALSEYRFKTTGNGGMSLSANIDDTWKCWIDVMGYIITTAGGWQERSAIDSDPLYDPEYAAICAGRGGGDTGSTFSGGGFGHNYDGRRLW